MKESFHLYTSVKQRLMHIQYIHYQDCFCTVLQMTDLVQNMCIIDKGEFPCSNGTLSSNRPCISLHEHWEMSRNKNIQMKLTSRLIRTDSLRHQPHPSRQREGCRRTPCCIQCRTSALQRYKLEPAARSVGPCGFCISSHSKRWQWQ